MRIVISGSTGLIGSSLVADLEAAGLHVTRLVRSSTASPPPGSAMWQPSHGDLDPSIVDGTDVVINLNGSNIGARRWNSSVKEELHASRLDATRTMITAIAAARERPRLLINASAVGYYGDRGDEVLDEDSEPGTGFLADLTRDWEEPALALSSDEVRVVVLRLGMVIAKGGGALERMLTPFNLGLGGPIGSGDQWWPWIAMEDVIGAVRFAMDNLDVRGPVNLTAPGEVTSREFAKILGGVLNRPAVLPLPAFAARLMMGEMADPLVLASTRARPTALLRYGYTFRVPQLETAIRHAID